MLSGFVPRRLVLTELGLWGAARGFLAGREPSLRLDDATRRIFRRFAELLLESVARFIRQLGELAKGRQILERLEPEELEEMAGGAVDQRSPGLVPLAEDAHEIALEQQLQHRTGVDAAHVVHLGPRHRLAVGDDGKRLHLRAREPHRLLLGQVTHERRVLRAGPEHPSACYFVEVHTARRVVLLQLDEELLHLLLRRVRELRELARLDGAVRCEDERLEEPAEVRALEQDVVDPLERLARRCKGRRVEVVTAWQR